MSENTMKDPILNRTIYDCKTSVEASSEYWRKDEKATIVLPLEAIPPSSVTRKLGRFEVMEVKIDSNDQINAEHKTEKRMEENSRKYPGHNKTVIF